MTAAGIPGQAERVAALLDLPKLLREAADTAEQAAVAAEAPTVAALLAEIEQHRREAQRADDLIGELRRQMVSMERQLNSSEGWEWGVRHHHGISDYIDRDCALSALSDWQRDVPDFPATLVRRRVQHGYWLDVTP